MKSWPGVASLLAVAVASSCATQFNAQSVRAEIVRQTGEDPQRAVVFNLGPVTMAVTREVLGDPSRPTGTLPPGARSTPYAEELTASATPG